MTYTSFATLYLLQGSFYKIACLLPELVSLGKEHIKFSPLYRHSITIFYNQNRSFKSRKLFQLRKESLGDFNSWSSTVYVIGHI